MQEKNKFMNAQSKRILSRKSGVYDDATSMERDNRSGSTRKSGRRSRRLLPIKSSDPRKHANDDLDDIFSLKDEEFANMGYVDSMKMQEMQRFNLKENKDF